MKYFWKVNVYEIQCILYWILGVMILHIGTWHWVGWISIGWGWITFIFTTIFAIKHREDIRKEF